MFKRAFTLIELLVVVAIISILAAILFPVFSQAKEAAKKTVTLTNFKQMATGMLIYTGDNDDCFPLAWSPDTVKGVWRSVSGEGGTSSFVISLPAGWRGGTYAQSPRVDEDNVMWANSIFPYIKNYGIYEAAGMPRFRSGTPAIVTDYGAHEGAFKASSVTFNGMLHSYQLSAVARPSQHPMLWQGMFKRAYEGFARTNPELDCYDLATPCRFNSSGYPQQGAWTRFTPGYGYIWFGAIAPYGTAWIYGHGLHFIQDDSSARFQAVNAPLMSSSATGAITRLGQISTRHPFTRMDSDAGAAPGTPFYSGDCDAGLDGQPPADDGTTLNIAYDCFFRPDSEYSYTQATASDY
ncbi:MAG: type II secretion system protein [Fimbriimonas ginsengisoli]|uniref:Type II secretion system protein n=1 Tax=Fimbriimonas ginsengisoli TaxID=1005039 RepID=A0A931LU11_FIMGI|nr:type II secretion system protein [Fimbriimonas ginsengisoli]